MKITYDGTFNLASGRSRKETHWKNKVWAWSGFIEKISETHHTAETYAQYMAEKKSRQDEIKDVGGFVGGYLIEGRRKSGNVLNRQLLTLDIDFGHMEIWEDYKLLFENAAAIYSTHKHSKEKPRFRLILPLNREVAADEYEPIARYIANKLDIQAFDDTTFEIARLMYWPSTSNDADYFFKYQDGPWISADEILSTYHNWRDASEWPISDRAKEVIHRDIKKAGDPTEKAGIVGTFCREYDIHQAIDKFLPGVYEPCDVEDRYTYKNGSTASGLVVYNKGAWAYSHHGTDPVSGRLCNAFDLVRLHLFGIMDEDAKENTPINHMPSYLSMIEFASKDSEVRRRIVDEKNEGAKNDFKDYMPTKEEDDWKKNLDIDKKGNIKNTIANAYEIIKNHPDLKDKFALNLFEMRETVKSDLPWRKITKDSRYITDRDDALLRAFLERYGITGPHKIADALQKVILDNAFHPVKEYLSAIQWDRQKRVENLTIDYLGAENTKYIKEVTKKALVAAVARVFDPGVKFDFVLVIIGKQGTGKSTLIKKLGYSWYSDSFSGVTGKEAYEAIQGVWILELAELAGLNKAEFEQIKHFITKQEDRFRVAYGKRTENFPRQCIFIGTTNTHDFLKDPTGNRRFWPVLTGEKEPNKSIFNELTQSEIDQVWAEAVHLYKQGETLYLNPEMEASAIEQQKYHRVMDDRYGLIENYLNKLLPDDWDSMSLMDRRNYLTDPLASGHMQREKVCIAEIWCELFMRNQSEMTNHNTKELHNIMRTMHGWEEIKSGPRVFSLYGNQRGYKRIENTTHNYTETQISVVNY